MSNTYVLTRSPRNPFRWCNIGCCFCRGYSGIRIHLLQLEACDSWTILSLRTIYHVCSFNYDVCLVVKKTLKLRFWTRGKSTKASASAPESIEKFQVKQIEQIWKKKIAKVCLHLKMTHFDLTNNLTTFWFNDASSKSSNASILLLSEFFTKFTISWFSVFLIFIFYLLLFCFCCL